MIDFSQIIHRTFDDSYVITKNGMPYHVYPYSAEFAEEWDEAFAYAEAHPECVTEEKPYVPTLDELKAAKKAWIDAETSAAIASGFDYAVGGVTYHFSYDTFDQQNFADTANVCLMKQSGMPGLPDSVTWNAYTPGGELERLTFDASAPKGWRAPAPHSARTAGRCISAIRRTEGRRTASLHFPPHPPWGESSAPAAAFCQGPRA